ncbi:hypothetical protein CDL12_15282 [Handroanthus impetiginosus]|uniref:F-box domain-containing protein n=1 Tax=Handroanthus impetiginosus TaxID=429701 RepID=A0A2G9H3M0_9LAMI|nr:hypothetical protein CDL12_15282 [Handroanthus impetiginosus]
MAQSLTDLPQDILVEILIRLSMKALCSTRCVCRTFLQLTSPLDSYSIALHSSNATQSLVFQFGDSSKLSRLLRLKPIFEIPKFQKSNISYFNPNKFVHVNSCNALLYLARRHAPDERFVVCNPVTNEYIMIPDVDEGGRLWTRTKVMWLGYSPCANQYKMLRIFSYGHGDPLEVGAQLDPFWRDILLFDFDSEMFGHNALPLEFGEELLINKQCMSIGVLGDHLCLSYNAYGDQHVDLWVMKKQGDQVSRIKEFVVGTVRSTGKPVCGQFKSLQVLRNVEILMFWISNDLVCYDSKNKSVRYLGYHWLRLDPKALAFTPGFISLKDTLFVDEVKVHDLRPSYMVFAAFGKTCFSTLLNLHHLQEYFHITE